jgi:hypothetical protein
LGSDTLHTARQLSQSRPRLKNLLGLLLRKKVVVVCGDGGWDDAFTEALMDTVRDDASFPEILWTLYPPEPTLDEEFVRLLGSDIDRGRVNLYRGVDCNRFLHYATSTSTSIKSSSAWGRRIRSYITNRPKPQTVVEGDVEDSHHWLRSAWDVSWNSEESGESRAKVMFIKGFGGQGKSTLAARCRTIPMLVTSRSRRLPLATSFFSELLWLATGGTHLAHYQPLRSMHLSVDRTMKN